MIVKMTIHKGTKGKRQNHIDIPRLRDTKNTNISIHRFPLAKRQLSKSYKFSYVCCAPIQVVHEQNVGP